MKSLRTRLIAGSLLWTVGLVSAVNLVTLLLLSHRHSGPLVHLAAMLLVALGLLAAGLLQLKSVLAPFEVLRRELAAVRAGSSLRVEGELPSEIAPLVTELNALLELRARQVERAQARAADLAHTLKTPLAVIGQEAERLAAAGHAEAAAAVAQEVERLSRQLEQHLAQARAAASAPAPGTRCQARASAEGLKRTLARLYTEKNLRLELDIPAEHLARVEPRDLDELLGNLLDNACKWARSRIVVSSRREGENLVIEVHDDGPGLPDELRQKVLARGVRADESKPGSGIGLAIVRDLVELYGGEIKLEASPLGGLKARLMLPALASDLPLESQGSSGQGRH